jgi:DNA modification methylase
MTDYLDRIICGDCLEVMRGLPDGCVDAVVTDPPYSSGTRREGQKSVRKSMNRGVDSGEWFSSDCLTTNGFVWLMRECAVEWKRLLKPGGHVLCFIDWRMMPNLSGAIESADLRNLGLLVWDKTYFGMGTHFRNQHELILHFTNGKPSPAQRLDIGNVLSVKPIRGGEHATEKPVELITKLISVVSPEGATILDPFLGSGTTAVACVETGRHYIGIELEEKYCEIARRRVAEATPSLFAAS